MQSASRKRGKTQIEKASKRKIKSKHWETLKLGRGARNPVKNIPSGNLSKK